MKSSKYHTEVFALNTSFHADFVKTKWCHKKQNTCEGNYLKQIQQAKADITDFFHIFLICLGGNITNFNK